MSLTQLINIVDKFVPQSFSTKPYVPAAALADPVAVPSSQYSMTRLLSEVDIEVVDVLVFLAPASKLNCVMGHVFEASINDCR